MQTFRMKFVVILVIVATFLGVMPVFSAPAFAAASQTVSQTVDPTECRNDVTATVNNMNKYTLIVLQDLNSPGFTHVHGAAYIGGNFNSTNSHVFGQNSTLTLADNALVVVGTTAIPGGGGQLHIQKGNALFGQNLPSSRMVMNSGGSATQNNTLSNTAMQSALQNASASFAAYATVNANNSAPTIDNSGKLIFSVNNVTANGLAVFNINASQLFNSSANNQVEFVYGNGINAATTTVLVNVSGTNPNWNSNASLGNSVKNNAARILWNFPQATTIDMNKNWYGAMLAPYATVNFGSQNMVGSIAVKEFKAAGEIHNPNFLTSNTTPLKDVCGTSNPAINIKKYTNEEDADSAPGPMVAVGSTVTWKYVVTNSGNVALSEVTVTDDKGVTPVYQSGDTNSNNKLDTNETWIYEATGTAVEGQYANLGTAQGKSPINQNVNDSDPSHYFGSNPAIVIKKYTNGEDADSAPGPMVAVGSTVTWKYVVTNTGNVALSDVTVTDDKGVTPVYQEGDTNGNGKLDTNETWIYLATGTAVEWQYANIGTAEGKSPINQSVNDTDPSHYFGSNPAIVIKKYTNGEDADSETGPSVLVGNSVTWTYVVTNAGNVPLSNIIVTDDKGVTPLYQGGDANNDGKLDLNETWMYQATGVATAGQYVNTGSVKGTSPDKVEVSDSDLSHYFGTTPLPQPASLGDRVWNDANQNGMQDQDEVGVANVTVELLNVCGGTVIDTQITDADGLYRFDNLSAGDYVVHFVLRDGYLFTAVNQGDSNIDSDADLTSGCTPTITLAAGQNDMSWDAGIYQPLVQQASAELGDKVWNDANQNGIQDIDEAGVANVSVELLNVCGGTVLETRITDANGLYLFDGLEAGSYVVRFVLPEGYRFTTPDQGDNNTDSDADITTGCTPSITLQEGQEDMSWDAGIVLVDVVPPTKPLLSALGDTVWYDLNKNGLQDNGETGVAGVAVSLYGAGGTFVATQETNEQGQYLFENLLPGSYYVEFANVPGYSFTRYNVGEDRAIDANPLVPWVEVTSSDGGVEAKGNMPLTYTLSLTNTDTTLPATDVAVIATVPAGTSFLADKSSEGWNCTTAGAGGVCTMTLSSLAANASASVKFIVMVNEQATLLQHLDLLVELTNGSLARSEVVTLAPGETNLTVDAGVVRVESSVSTIAPTAPTNLPDGEQPQQRQFVFLPSVQSQK